MFRSRVISDDGLKCETGGLVIDIRLPWYSALPLSTVELAEVKIDGRLVDKRSMTLEINARIFEAEDIPNHPEEWWFEVDSALVHVKGVEVEAGTAHDVSVTVAIRPPYIPNFFRLTECTKSLTAN